MAGIVREERPQIALWTNSIISRPKPPAISVTDPMGNATQYEYSPTTGTLTSITDAEGGVISYEYDLLGRLTKLTDQNGHSTIYTYDVLNRVETETNPLNQTTVYTYDDTAGGCSSCSGGSGNLASVTDPAGRTTFYEYDEADRLTTVTYSNSSDMVVHTYDDYGRRIMTFDNRLPVADFPTQTFTWTYDKFDRMLTETYPDGEQVVWTYDINGRRTSMTDPDGNESSYFYNELSNNKKLLAVVHPFAEDIFSYNSKGLLEYDRVFDPGQYAHKYGSSLMKQGGGYTPFAYDEEERTVIRHTYDTLNRLKTQEYHLNYEPARVHYITATHNYNAASMRTSTVYTSPHPYLYTSFLPHTMSYSYDDTYRLVSEIRLDDTDATEWRNTYSYDPAGNRTYSAHYNGTTTSTLSSQFNAFNQLNYSSVNGSYGFLSDYDQSGNLIAKEPIYGDTEVYYHDRENRLDRHRLEYSPGYGPLQSYYYDFSGRLLMRVNNNGHKEKYYYDGINRLLTREEPDALCSRTKEVFALKPSAIGQVFLRRTYTYTGSGGNCQAGKMSHDMFYNYDPVGNVIAELPRYTASVNPVDMGAFGQVYTGGYDGPRLTTKHYDGASGLYYFGARWYDPLTGRWVEKEPLGLDGPNLYIFNFNRPLTTVDMNGLVSLSPGSVGFDGLAFADQCIQNCANTIGDGKKQLDCWIDEGADALCKLLGDPPPRSCTEAFKDALPILKFPSSIASAGMKGACYIGCLLIASAGMGPNDPANPPVWINPNPFGGPYTGPTGGI